MSALTLTALGILVLCVGLLAGASPVLEFSLGGTGDGFPVGTLVAWTGLVAWPLLFFGLRRRLWKPRTLFDRAIRYAFLLLIALGLVWGLLSYLILGNWALNYDPGTVFAGSERAMSRFWLGTGLLMVLPPVLWLAHLLFGRKG